MNKKKKGQLLALLLLLLAVAAAFITVKISQQDDSEEMAASEEETFPVTQIDSSQVKEIGIINGEETVNLIREGEEWKCREEVSSEEVSIDSSLVENFLAKACQIIASEKIEDVTDLSQYGLKEPAVNITLQWDDNMYIIKLGDYNSIIGSYYLSINEEPVVYTVDSSVYYGLNKHPGDFKKAKTEGTE